MHQYGPVWLTRGTGLGWKSPDSLLVIPAIWDHVLRPSHMRRAVGTDLPCVLGAEGSWSST